MSQLPIYMEEENESLYNDLLNTYLRSNISQNGFVVPSQQTTTITAISQNMPSGTIWYDSDTDEMKVKIGGVVKIVQVI